MRKAHSGDMLLLVFRSVAVILAIGVLVFLVNGSIEKNLDLLDLRFYPLAERLLYSDTCFALKEERVYPGIIDASKFTQSRLETCMEPMDAPIGMKVELSKAGNTETIYYNKEHYEDILPLTFSNRYEKRAQRYYVLVDGHPSNMYIEAVWRE